MFLNQGKFRQNGGCGYVLKPEVMRNPNGTGEAVYKLLYEFNRTTVANAFICVNHTVDKQAANKSS